MLALIANAEQGRSPPFRGLSIGEALRREPQLAEPVPLLDDVVELQFELGAPNGCLENEVLNELVLDVGV